MKLQVLILAVALGGCASQPDIVADNFVTPSGVAGHIIYCGGFNSSIAECYDDARKVCAGDYNLIRQDVTVRQSSGPQSTENRNIQITCKAH